MASCQHPNLLRSLPGLTIMRCLLAGVVNGVQGSLQSAFEIASFVMGMLVPQTQHFHWLMLASFTAVAAAVAVYAKHVLTVRASSYQSLQRTRSSVDSRALAVVDSVEQRDDQCQPEKADWEAEKAEEAEKGGVQLQHRDGMGGAQA